MAAEAPRGGVYTVADRLRSLAGCCGRRPVGAIPSSDGGHHDNLGLEALLRRRCQVIFVSDATWDPTLSFAELVRVVRRERRAAGLISCRPEVKMGNTIRSSL